MKQSGLGDNFYWGGYDLSGDVGALSKISGGPKALDLTGIDKSAPERVGGLRDGEISYQAWFNPSAGQAHPVLSALPTADQIATYCRGTTLGNPAACLVGKQLNYDGARDKDGNFTLDVQALANADGLEWGVQLTAGKRTDTAATNGTGVDLTTVSTAFGAQAYLQVFSFSGTDVTVKIQDSADNSSWADLTGGGFTQVTSAPTSQRIATASNQTVRRYLRAVTTTSAGFTSLVFSVVFMRNATSVSF